MPIDPSIPLQVKQIHVPTAQEMMSLQDLATRSQLNQTTLQEKKLELGQRNALLDVMKQPDATDPQTGLLTPVGLGRITQINPKMGMELGHQQNAITLQSMQFDEKKTAVKKNILSSYVTSYQNALHTTGGNTVEAEKIAREDTLKAIDEGSSSGHFASQGLRADAVDKLRQLPPPEQARTMVAAMGGTVAPPTPKAKEMRTINYAGPQGITYQKQQEFDSSTRKWNDIEGTNVPRSSTVDVGPGQLGPEDYKFMAKQYLAGDRTVLQNLGRGVQGARDLRMLRQNIRTEAEAAGMTPAHVAVKIAEFEGVKAAERTAGTREAQLGFAAHELDKFLPLAENAMNAVPRTGFKPINQLIQAGESQWSPQQAALVAANRAVINAFSMVASRGAQTVHNVEEAEKMLSTASSHDVYKAVLKQLKLEVDAALKAPKEVRKDIAATVTGEEPKEAPKVDIKSLLDKYK